MVEPIIREIEVNANPDAVFDAIAIDHGLLQWVPQMAGVHLEADTSQWKATWPDGVSTEGRIIGYERPSYLIWSWDRTVTPTDGDDAYIIETDVRHHLQILPQGACTVVRIEESGHQTQEIREINRVGIDQMLGAMKRYIENGESPT